MGRPPPSVEMIVTELRRSGIGELEDTNVVFKFSGAEHSSNQGGLGMSLKVENSRKVIPGSNRVVQHAMGSSWEPTTFNGEWKDSWGNRKTPSVGGFEKSGPYAFTMYQDFGKMVSRTPMVRVELGDISMVGLITDYQPTYIHVGHIQWQFVLSPHENENIDVAPQGILLKKSIPKWLEDCKDLGDTLFTSFDKRLTAASLKTERFATFSSALEEINDSLTRLDMIVNGGLDFEIIDRLLLLATTFRRIQASALNGVQVLSTVTSGNDVAFDSVINQLKHGEWIMLSMGGLWRMIGMSRDAEKDMRRRVGDRPMAIHYAREGESLEKISARYYGTPDNWRVIYDRNSLTSITLDGTEELVIPERRT